jgi:hypothetical protein
MLHLSVGYAAPLAARKGKQASNREYTESHMPATICACGTSSQTQGPVVCHDRVSEPRRGLGHPPSASPPNKPEVRTSTLRKRKCDSCADAYCLGRCEDAALCRGVATVTSAYGIKQRLWTRPSGVYAPHIPTGPLSRSHPGRVVRTRSCDLTCTGPGPLSSGSQSHDRGGRT